MWRLVIQNTYLFPNLIFQERVIESGTKGVPTTGSTESAGIKEPGPSAASQTQHLYRRPAAERTLLPVVLSMPQESTSSSSQSSGSDSQRRQQRSSPPTARTMTNSGTTARFLIFSNHALDSTLPILF